MVKIKPDNTKKFEAYKTIKQRRTIEHRERIVISKHKKPDTNKVNWRLEVENE